MGNKASAGVCCCSWRPADYSAIPISSKISETVPTCPEPVPTPRRFSRHLVLNMDVNKTVIMTDAATGKTAEAVVNEELANACWGYEVDGQWRMQLAQPSVYRPPAEPGEPEYVSYAEWVGAAFPGQEERPTRARLKGSFTCGDQPGSSLGELAKKMVGNLLRPDGGEVTLIPAFFELLLHLKRERRSFTLCFRTFGEDMEVIAEELTRFCEGKHPLYPGVRMDGSDGDPDYRLRLSDPDRFGTFHREDGQISLIMGTVEQPGEGRHRDVKDGARFYKGMPGVRILSGYPGVRDFLWKRCAVSGTIGLRDYYPYWKSKKMSSEGGKLFMFDPTRQASQHALFFDDNIGFEDSHIVQPISLRDPERRFFTTALLQSHLCKAEPLEAISDPFYFVRHVQRLERGFERKLQAQEKLKKTLLTLKGATAWRARIRDSRKALQGLDLTQYDAWKELRRSECSCSAREPPTEEQAKQF